MQAPPPGELPKLLDFDVNMLSQMGKDERIQYIGEKLYPEVSKMHPE